jgi:hypothetical protein
MADDETAKLTGEELKAFLDNLPVKKPEGDIPLLTYTAYCLQSQMTYSGNGLGWIFANWMANRDDACRVFTFSRIKREWIISLQRVGVCLQNETIMMCVHRGG